MTGYLLLLALATGVSLYSIVQLGRVRDVTHSVILEDNVLLDLHKSLAVLLAERRTKKVHHPARPGILRRLPPGVAGFRQEPRAGEGARPLPELLVVIERIGTLHIGYQTLFDEEAALRPDRERPTSPPGTG